MQKQEGWLLSEKATSVSVSFGSFLPRSISAGSNITQLWQEMSFRIIEEILRKA
jgi:hypothetical protein